MEKSLVAANAKNLALKHLEVIANIAIKSDAFSKSFFGKDGKDELIKFHFWNGFNVVLSSVPKQIPAFEGELLKTRLTKRMYDSEILNELDHLKPFTMCEFLAIVKCLLQKRSNGKKDNLLKNSHANIFYVRLKNKVVAKVIRWRPFSRVWDLSKRDLNNHRWYVDYCVFSRS